MNLNINNKIKEFLIIIIAAILTFLSFVTEGLLLFGEYIIKAIMKCLNVYKRSQDNKLLTNNK